MEKIRVLAVLPYRELEELSLQVAQSFPQIQLDVFTGNLEEATEYTKIFPGKRFDIIISRGGTAQMLRQRVNVPVVEVEISAYDMLRVLKLAEQCSKNFVIVGYSSITGVCRTLCDILKHTNIEIYEVNAQGVTDCLRDLARRGVSLVIGDVITTQTAARLGMRSMLITSSKESVEKAFEEAINLYQVIQQSQNTDALFHRITDACQSGILLLDDHQGICYANAALREYGLFELKDFLVGFLPALEEQETLHAIKKFGNRLLDIHASCLTHNKQNYSLFYVDTMIKPFSPTTGTAIENYEECQHNSNFLFSDSRYIQPVLERISKARESSLPVFISGAIGTEKGSVARYLHWSGPNRTHPFICINCALLSEKKLQSLFSSHSSPINSKNCTIFFENVHTLPLELQQDLDNYISDSAIQLRHRIISSATVDINELVEKGQFLRSLYKKLYCLSIHMPSLNERTEDIPALASLYIGKFNAEYGKQVIGLEDDAIELLKQFHWKLNLDQFQKVLQQLVVMSDSYYITAQEVKSVLAECNPPAPQGSGLQLDLSKTLDEIERDIINYIIAEEGMNQSAAAKRLGISRSTIWRKIN